MTVTNSLDSTCVIIGASHAGVNCAFSLRAEGWLGKIILFDSDPAMPYHRPPLSKAYLTSNEGIGEHLLMAEDSYEKDNIQLNLGVTITEINRADKKVILADGTSQFYDKLVLATGARPLIPSITGIDKASNLFPLRTLGDVENIKSAFNTSKNKSVVIIGGGYIGLETAASIKKMGANVTVLERESRILARVTAPEMSTFFEELHAKNEVAILTEKNVVEIKTTNGLNTVICSDESTFEAAIIIVGVGIRVNTELANNAGLSINNGIVVDQTACTSDAAIFAIGDCTNHFNSHYERFIRLECVQNAVDQAKVAASTICGGNLVYNAIPWFWSDQYDIKLQMVGLSEGYTDIVVRKEEDSIFKMSIWYFRGSTLLAVDAVNNGKAYVLGTKFIKEKSNVDKHKLADANVPFKPAELLVGNN